MNKVTPAGPAAGSLKSAKPDTATASSASPSGTSDAQSPSENSPTAGISAAASLSANAKDALQTATRAVKEQATQFAGDIGHELSQTAEGQKVRGANAIQGFARAIGSAADELEGQSPRIAQVVRDAAQKVDGLSSNVRSRNVNELVISTTELARAQPILFIGGAIAAGFVLSRFLKSSSSHASSAGTVAQDHPAASD